MPESSSGAFLLSRVPPGVSAKDHFAQFVLDAPAAAALKQAAREDASRYVYNGVVSFLGAFGGLCTQQPGWAVTKLYYSAFYVGRAALCRAGRVIFHVPKPSGAGHTQYELQVSAGQRAQVVSKPPSTHKLVACRFQSLGYPSFMTGLAAASLDPLRWLMEQREYWQYRAARFPDPDFPPVLEWFGTGKMQQRLEAYAADERGVYLADPDHALVAIPFRLVVWALSVESLLSPAVADDADLAHLRKRCHVGTQTLNAILKHLN